MASPVRAVRLPTELADRLEWAAEKAGGRGRAVEAMLLNQQLPSRSWFSEYRFRGRISCPARVTLRLTGDVVKKLRDVTGRRSVSEAIRLLTLYTFTDGAAGSRHPAEVRQGQAGPAKVLVPVAGPSITSPVRPPSQPSVAGLQSGFEHLPSPPPGNRYACEDPGCGLSLARLGGGIPTRCRLHSGFR